MSKQASCCACDIPAQTTKFFLLPACQKRWRAVVPAAWEGRGKDEGNTDLTYRQDLIHARKCEVWKICLNTSPRQNTVISSSKLKQNSPPSQKDFVWDSPDLTKRALVRHTPYTVKISRLLMLFKYDQNRSILQMLSPKLPSLFTYNSDIPSGI